jgi:hypothetical protein
MRRQSMPSYTFLDDVTEWSDECGGAEAGERYLIELVSRASKASVLTPCKLRFGVRFPF